MRLYKVKTRVDLIIETNWLFKKEKYECYFTYKSKYIYAKDKVEAKRKYNVWVNFSMEGDTIYIDNTAYERS